MPPWSLASNAARVFCRSPKEASGRGGALRFVPHLRPRLPHRALYDLVGAAGAPDGSGGKTKTPKAAAQEGRGSRAVALGWQPDGWEKKRAKRVSDYAKAFCAGRADVAVRCMAC